MSGLRVDHVTRTYPPDVIALKDVSFQVPSGVLGLVGPNGAGKSTLLRILATLQTPDEGEVYLDGISLLSEPGRVRKQLGYLPQDPGVYPRVTAAEMLGYLIGVRGITCHSTTRARVIESLEEVHLADVADRRLDQFSLGMRQRFGIACAMLGRPRLLIVDEPTAGLDPQERRYFQRLVANYGESNIVLISTHLIEDLIGICDQVAILHGGRLLLQGSVNTLTTPLKDQVWETSVPWKEIDDFRHLNGFLGWRPAQGGATLRLHSIAAPEGNWNLVEPDLEDLYSFHMQSSPTPSSECNRRE